MKKTKRILSLFLTLALILTMIQTPLEDVNAVEGIVDEEETVFLATDGQQLRNLFANSEFEPWRSGRVRIVLQNDIIINGDFGTAHTIATIDLNGHTLITRWGLGSLNSLTIMDSQYTPGGDNTGILRANNNRDGLPAISTANSTLIIESGIVEAIGNQGGMNTNGGPGIGGFGSGSGGTSNNNSAPAPNDGGTVIINGGEVTAIGGPGSAGIGGASGIGGAYPNFLRGGHGGTVTINGGIVTAIGGYGAAGIGGGRSRTRSGSDVRLSIGGNSAAVTINGGTVRARGGERIESMGGLAPDSGLAPDIGGGIGHASGTRQTQGGDLIVNGGTLELQLGGAIVYYLAEGATITGEGAWSFPICTRNHTTCRVINCTICPPPQTTPTTTAPTTPQTTTAPTTPTTTPPTTPQTCTGNRNTCQISNCTTCPPIAVTQTVTRQTVTEFCNICRVSKTIRVTVLRENGVVIRERRVATKRDEQGQLRGACQPPPQPPTTTAPPTITTPPTTTTRPQQSGILNNGIPWSGNGISITQLQLDRVSGDLIATVNNETELPIIGGEIRWRILSSAGGVLLTFHSPLPRIEVGGSAFTTIMMTDRTGHNGVMVEFLEVTILH